MTRFTFLHAADLHLDTPFAGLGRVDARLAETLRDASLLAWDRLVGLAISRKVAFVVLAGDIYDGAERGLRAQLRFRDGCARLSDHDIPVFIIHGNHDPLGGWSAVRSWPASVTIFPADRVDSVPVIRDGQRLATIHGISYDRPDVRDNLALRFPDTKQSGGGIAVGVLHCATGDIGDHAAYAPCTLDDLRSRAIDYWALGHVHGHAILDRSPAVVYPGCLQGRSPKPGETGPKGAVLVSVDGERVSAIEHLPVAEITFDEIGLDITDIDDIGGLIDALNTHAADQAGSSHGGAILTARLTGSGPVHDDLRRPNAPADMVRRLRETATADAGRLIWWAKVRDRTTPALDWAALRARDDLVAAIIQRGEALLDDPAAAKDFCGAIWKQGDRWARRTPDDAERARLLTEAIRVAVTTLETER